MKQHYHINVDTKLCADCRILMDFLRDDSSLCRPFIDFLNMLVADEIEFFTDASGSQKLGFGCVFGNEWVADSWNSHFIARMKPSIEYLELFMVAIGIELW